MIHNPGNRTTKDCARKKQANGKSITDVEKNNHNMQLRYGDVHNTVYCGCSDLIKGDECVQCGIELQESESVHCGTCLEAEGNNYYEV